VSRVQEITGFNFCTNLKTIQFTANCFLRVIEGFHSFSIASMEIPASVEIIKGFEDSSVSRLIFEERTMIKTIEIGSILWELNRHCREVFIVYDDRDLRKCRGRFHVMSRSVY
jgi:hypothetical protein